MSEAVPPADDHGAAELARLEAKLDAITDAELDTITATAAATLANPSARGEGGDV